MNKEITIQDECQMEGAIIVLQRYAKHLKRHLNNAVLNYESTDFDGPQFLSDVAYALDNAEVVRVATETITSILTTMRHTIVESYNEKEE